MSSQKQSIDWRTPAWLIGGAVYLGVRMKYGHWKVYDTLALIFYIILVLGYLVYIAVKYETNKDTNNSDDSN